LVADNHGDLTPVEVQISVPAAWEAEIRVEFEQALATVPGASGEVIDVAPDDDARFEPITTLIWVGCLVANSVGGYAITQALDRVFRRKPHEPTATPVTAKVLLPDGTQIEVSTADPESLNRAITQVRAAIEAR
jgi:hypothetical protein